MKKLQKKLDLARELTDNGEETKAISLYNEILLKKENWSVPHYNLGLIYKYQLDWEKSFKHNQRAVELDPDSESNNWNLGIAATMLQKWKIARNCWNIFGMKYEDVDLDPEGNLGNTPIRINLNAKAEVVWATRIDPARARIISIPFPESNHCFGDIVLNDGAPMGTRSSNGKEYNVFNELQLLEKSNYVTYSLKCDFQKIENYHLLEEKCLEKNIEIENWTTDTEVLCKQCSEGTPHENHEHLPVYESKEMIIAFASQSDVALYELLDQWSESTQIEYHDFFHY